MSEDTYTHQVHQKPFTGKAGLVLSSLYQAVERHPGKVAFSTSFGAEDQLIAHIIFTNRLPVKVFTLDTGRFFPETYQTWAMTLEKYGQPIEAFCPDRQELEKLLYDQGPLGFYQSVEQRKKCCEIRKLNPLRRALNGMTLWISGRRSEQSANRGGLPLLEQDKGFGISKLNPLRDWSFTEVMNFLQDNSVPKNPLHEQGYLSIGCQCCTRAISEDEEFRAGRWWWETDKTRECGLHLL